MNNYQRFFRQVLHGERATVRGLQVTYVTNTSYTVMPGIVIRRPGDNPAIGFIELLQILAGVFDIEQFRIAAPHARLDLFTHQSTCSLHVGTQIDDAIEELRRDMYSRRAVVMIARPDDELSMRPCALAMQFQIFRGRLYTTVTMRSSDLVWLPYDIIQFGGVALAVANCLLVPAGTLTINAANSHVYDATRPVRNAFDDGWMFEIPRYHEISEYRRWALSILERKPHRADLEKIFNMRVRHV